jgi:hypothetical protein
MSNLFNNGHKKLKLIVRVYLIVINILDNINKGNNKITELRTILQRESQNSDKISQQLENCENRNDSDLVPHE